MIIETVQKTEKKDSQNPLQQTQQTQTITPQSNNFRRQESTTEVISEKTTVIPNFNKTKEKKLFESCVDNRNKWSEIAKDFPGVDITYLQNTLSKITKRILNKINRENGRTHPPSSINKLKTIFILKIFKTAVDKRKQESSEGFIDLIDVFQVYAFSSIKKMREQNTSLKLKLMKNFLNKVMFTQKKEARKLEELRREHCALANKFTKEFKGKEGREIDGEFFGSLMAGCHKVEKVCLDIKNRSDNRFRENELWAYRIFLEKKAERLNKKAEFIKNREEEEFSFVYKRVIEVVELVEECLERLKQAKLLEVVSDMNKVFLYSDDEGGN